MSGGGRRGSALPARTVPQRVVIPSPRRVQRAQNPDLAGWYEPGTTPGSQGPAVIAGHVTWSGADAVFKKPKTMKAGDTVEVERGDGKTATFTVDRSGGKPADAVDRDDETEHGHDGRGDHGQPLHQLGGPTLTETSKAGAGAHHDQAQADQDAGQTEAERGDHGQAQSVRPRPMASSRTVSASGQGMIPPDMPFVAMPRKGWA